MAMETFDVILGKYGRVTIPKTTRLKHKLEVSDLITLSIVNVRKTEDENKNP